MWTAHRSPRKPDDIIHDDQRDKTVKHGGGVPHLRVPHAQVASLTHDAVPEGAEEIFYAVQLSEIPESKGHMGVEEIRSGKSKTNIFILRTETRESMFQNRGGKIVMESILYIYRLGKNVYGNYI